MAKDDFTSDDEEVGMSDMMPPEVRTTYSPAEKLKRAIKSRRRSSNKKGNGEQGDGSNRERRVQTKSSGGKKKIKIQPPSAPARWESLGELQQKHLYTITQCFRMTKVLLWKEKTTVSVHCCSMPSKVEVFKNQRQSFPLYSPARKAYGTVAAIKFAVTWCSRRKRDILVSSINTWSTCAQ